MSVPFVDHLDGFADLDDVEGESVVVDICDRLSRELDDDIAALKSRFLGGAAFDHSAQEQALHFGAVVWNGSREGSDRIATATLLLRASNLDELGTLVEIGELLGENRAEVRDPLQILEVDELRAIRRPVILLV